ncbi:hypothetical protein ERO13_D11G058150v2 [Gossypium hirsutum]|uniref:Protein bangles and beads isoform X2 n=1 Tax=Gossypium hirsutum TaxID=3635 RepID=A0ABM3B3F7_GOSHI|nr:protein bangles and beads-like isoform X2 [Gossypium hirsutum]KAG4119108.1 hypothetical protein ERO13_D11G058150v2 [Gossypium hirsutum]
MGCCAAKPKVLKGQEAEEPIPIPSSKWGKESVPEPTEPENKVEPDLNHHGNTRRSLSNLFKEEEMGMLAKNDNNAESEPTKCAPMESVTEESSKPAKQESAEPVYIEPNEKSPTDAEKLNVGSVILGEEPKEPVKPIQQTYEPDSMQAAHGNIEPEQSVEAKPVPDMAAKKVKEDNVNMRQEREEPAKADSVRVPPVKIIEVKSTSEEATVTEKLNEGDIIIEQEMEEPAKPMERNKKPDIVVDTPRKNELEFEDPAKLLKQIFNPVRMSAPPGNIESVQRIKAYPTPEGENDTQVFPKPIDNKPDPVFVMPGVTEPRRSIEAKLAPTVEIKIEELKEEDEEPAKPNPGLESVQSIEAKPKTPDGSIDTAKQKLANVIMNRKIKEPAKPLQITESPESLILAPAGNVEPVESIEAKSEAQPTTDTDVIILKQ